MVADPGGGRALGIMLADPPTGVELPGHPLARGGDGTEPDEPPMTPGQRISLFDATASEPARRLARDFAAVPLNLPVMRLVQREMLPDSWQLHLAEVFVGGLLTRITPIGDEIPPDEVQYDFWPGVRELLLRETPTRDTLGVLEAVGRVLGVRLLPEGRSATPPPTLDNRARPFVEVAASVLRTLGGRFSRPAEPAIPSPILEPIEPVEVPEDETLSPPEFRVWELPFDRNPHFVGREGELAKMKEALTPANNRKLINSVTLVGMAGIGKTQIAVEFAHRHAEDYDVVLTLVAASPVDPPPSFGDLTRPLNLPEAYGEEETDDDEEEARTDAVFGWLETHSRWLLLLDGHWQPEKIEPAFFRLPHGHIIITSINPDWPPLTETIRVSILPRADSIELLRKDVPEGDVAGADRLAAQLGDWPLALAEAGANLRRNSYRVDQYWPEFVERFRQSMPDEAVTNYGLPIISLISMMLGWLRGEGNRGTDARTLLERCTSSDPIRFPSTCLSTSSPTRRGSTPRSGPCGDSR